MVERIDVEKACTFLGIQIDQKELAIYDTLYNTVLWSVIRPLVDSLSTLTDLREVIDKLCSSHEIGVCIHDTHPVIKFLRGMDDSFIEHTVYAEWVHTFFHNMLEGYMNKTPEILCAKKARDESVSIPIPISMSNARIVSANFVSINYTERCLSGDAFSDTLTKDGDICIDMASFLDNIIKYKVLPPIPEGHVILYHGTTHFQSTKVALNPRHDVSSHKPINNFDFGHAFYLTNNIETASVWAIRKSAQGTAIPAVVAFCVPIDFLGLTYYSYYNYGSSQSKSLVRSSFFSDIELIRSDPSFEHTSFILGYDVICGPSNRRTCRIENLQYKKKSVRKTKSRETVYVSQTHPSQFAFRTKKSTDFIIKYTKWVSIMLLMKDDESTPLRLTKSIL